LLEEYGASHDNHRSSVATAAAQAQDVTLLINNAGASVNANFLASPVAVLYPQLAA
jgi:short-subunit dehydrogenase